MWEAPKEGVCVVTLSVVPEGLAAAKPSGTTLSVTTHTPSLGASHTHLPDFCSINCCK
ncbi:PPE family protein [Mycobacterium tuberculosis]|nr:PPE family protein [Mycobacterium tuberculosis]